MSNAEALENFLDDNWPREGGRSDIVRVLAQALDAAGFRPPARTVSTVEELETVLAGALLFSPRTNNVWWRRTNRPRLRWTGSGGDFAFDEDFIRLEGPLTILHDGGA